MGIPAINPSKKQGQYFTREPRLDLEEEGERFTVATKRNVTLTGNMNKYLQDSINGMPNEVLVAYIEDAKEFVYNLTGDSDPVNFTDGGTETAGPACYIQNNSLNGAKAGMD
jgi:hypothetical protein